MDNREGNGEGDEGRDQDNGAERGDRAFEVAGRAGYGEEVEAGGDAGIVIDGTEPDHAETPGSAVPQPGLDGRQRRRED